MATKKRGLAAFRSKSKKTRRPRPRPRANPSGGVVDELKTTVAPAVGAYLATRLLSRVIYMIVQRKFPRLGKHAGALAAAGGFAGAYWGASKMQSLKPYHGAIAAGAGVGAAHTLFTTYVPKYGWIMADPKPDDVVSPKAKALAAAQAAQAQATSGYLTLEDELEAEAEKVANAAIGDDDAIRESLAAPPAAQMSRGPAATASDDDDDDDFGDILGDDDGDWGNEAAWQN